LTVTWKIHHAKTFPQFDRGPNDQRGRSLTTFVRLVTGIE
jgi:hypothetical protein